MHAYGVPVILHSLEDRIKILEDSFKVFESKFKKQWDTLPEDYKSDLLNGITAFEVRITRLEGKFKLSQNRTEGDRQRIIDKLGSSGDKVKNDLAKFIMK